MPSTLVCFSVGWLLYDGPECKAVVPHVTVANDNVKRQGCGDMTIPTRAVRDIKDLMSPTATRH